jgi:hypothetical protein
MYADGEPSLTPIRLGPARHIAAHFITFGLPRLRGFVFWPQFSFAPSTAAVWPVGLPSVTLMFCGGFAARRDKTDRPFNVTFW